MTLAQSHQLSSTSADLLQPQARKAQITIYSIVGFFMAAMGWSMYATVLQVSTGTGQVIPENRLKTVQSLDGGVVSEVLVKPGDSVVEGSLIAKLDPIYAGSSLNETAEQVAGFEATSQRLKGQLAFLARLRKEIEKPTDDLSSTGSLSLGEDLNAALLGATLSFSENLSAKNPKLVAENTALFKTAMQELIAAILSGEQQIVQRQLEQRSASLQLSTVTSALAIARSDLAGLQKLLKAGAAGKNEVLVAKTRYNDLQGQAEQLRLAVPRGKSVISQLKAQINERIGNVEVRTAEQLNDTELRLAALNAQMPALQKRSSNTRVTATATGVIKQLAITSHGQVVRPGEIIADIVPSDSPLLIQVRVKPEDIAFVATGMPALIKLTAFDYSVFGSVEGTVKRIATDSTTDERGSVYYIVDVKAKADHIERKGETWPIKVGMVANVDIVTGKQSIFQYFTKPIHRMTQSALRER